MPDDAVTISEASRRLGKDRVTVRRRIKYLRITPAQVGPSKVLTAAQFAALEADFKEVPWAWSRRERPIN